LKICCTSIAAYVRVLVLVPSLASKVKVVGFPGDGVMACLSDEENHPSTNMTEIICTVHAILLHPY
jgi:hypothetical protein